jgi:hypothetical protein
MKVDQTEIDFADVNPAKLTDEDADAMKEFIYQEAMEKVMNGDRESGVIKEENDKVIQSTIYAMIVKVENVWKVKLKVAEDKIAELQSEVDAMTLRKWSENNIS